MKIAIDPGKGGGIAVELPCVVLAYDCPETQKDMFELMREIVSLANEAEIRLGIIEKVHSMPGQGVKSVWSFSANYASWQMALIACGVPFVEVPPQVWMKKLGGLPADKKARKNAIKDKMQKLYPKVKVTLKNADALALLSVS